MRRTRKQHLVRSGEPPWEVARIAARPGLEGLAANDADLVVVGAGITGACVSHCLSTRGHRVLVLDRGLPAQGSTRASAALITFELDLPLHRLARRVGTHAAVAAWRNSVDAVDGLRALARSGVFSCSWAERESLYVAGNAFGFRALKREAAFRETHGIAGTFVSARQLTADFGIDRTGGIHSVGVAVADPMQLTSGLFANAIGVEVRSGVEVHTVQTDGKGIVLETSVGVVRARAVIFCMGYSLLPGLPATGLSVDSTWALATAPHASIPEWLRHTIVWEGSEPYLYVRTTPDDRLIVGGRDEDGAECHADERLLARKARQLRDDAEDLFGLASLEVDHAWSGAFGWSASGLPVIGAVPGLPGCHIVAGFGGNGITHAMLAGQLLAAMLSDEPVPHADLYRPGSRARRAAAKGK